MGDMGLQLLEEQTCFLCEHKILFEIVAFMKDNNKEEK